VVSADAAAPGIVVTIKTGNEGYPGVRIKPGEAPWAFMSLKPDSCRKLVEAKWSPALAAKADLLAACNLESKPSSR